MKYKAVIFDLFGTLVCGISTQGYRKKLVEMASILSVDPSTFVRLWFEKSNERMNGVIKNYQEDIKHICEKMGTHLEDEQIKLATQFRFDMIQNQMVPRSDTIDVLSCSRARGCKTGVISDCSHETTLLWGGTPLATLIDVVVFSCSTGFAKPDPRIYQYMIKELGFEPADCLYVGDGASQELTGARSVGIQAVLLRIPNEDNYDVYGYDNEEWDGPVISSLTGVLDLIE